MLLSEAELRGDILLKQSDIRLAPSDICLSASDMRTRARLGMPLIIEFPSPSAKPTPLPWGEAIIIHCKSGAL